MTPRIGDLCSGYHGLGGAAETVTGGRTAWLCENDAAPSALLAYRFPGLHNYGDLKALEWADDPVDVLTAGYPCQPFSGAGQRLGTDDPRHLFPWIALGIERMRPPLVLLENVRGHLSLGFDVVLAELDRIGYDVRWTLLRAADVGAPHGRSRLWIAARAREVGGWPAPEIEPSGWSWDGGWAGGHGLFGPIFAGKIGTAGVMVEGLRWDSDAVTVNSGTLLGANQRQDATCLHGALLPTPAATDAKGARNSTSGRRPGSEHHAGDTLGDLIFDGRLLPTPEASDATGGRVSAVKGGVRDSGAKRAITLGTAVAPRHLLPTPVAADGGGPRASSAGWGLRDESRAIAAALSPWGPYAAAIARWERALGRPAPPPTEQGRNGPRLSPAFVEFLMGLPAGWVTDVPGMTRNAALKMLGNGVVPMQAAAAYALLGVSPALFAAVAA